MATHVPPAPGPSHHAAHSSGDFPPARVQEDDWEPIRTGSRRNSSPEGLRDSLEFIHTKITQHREIIDFIRARGINDSLHRTFLVQESSRAIVPVTVESHKIAHVSDLSLAISLATGGDSLQGIPLLQSDDDSLRMIPRHLSVSTHSVPLLVMVHLRDPLRGLLLPPHLRLIGKIGTLMILPSLPQFGR